MGFAWLVAIMTPTVLKRSVIAAISLVFVLFYPPLAMPQQWQAKNAPIGVDEGANDSSFSAFRKELLQAVERRDRQFVEAIVSPNIETGLGSGVGKKEFNKRWQDLAPDSKFWERMKRALTHGAQLDLETHQFRAPALNFDDPDGVTTQAIAWNNSATLRAKPEDSAPAISPLFNTNVTVLEPVEAGPIATTWSKVKTKQGKIGFVRSEDICSTYDHFAEFEKSSGKWWLVWFGFAGL
jgi:hypothetical protein